MVKLKSRQSELEVIFEADIIDEILEKAGYTETTSIAETVKVYYTKAKLRPADINIKYMTKDNYDKLLELISSDGNFFDIYSSDGDSFTKCFHKNDLSLKKNIDKQSDKKFYTGTLTIGVR